MQKKIAGLLSVLFISVAGLAQKPIHAVSSNDPVLPLKETLFSVLTVPEKVGTAFRLIVQNPEKKRIEVKINHRELGLLVDTSFTDPQFNCRYNFDQVQDGYYQVILINGKERIVKDIEINTVTRRSISIR